jgi:hypothetical protein
MRRSLTFITCLIGWLFAEAQMNRITTSNPFFYEEFREGIVFFTEGDPVRVSLNYNFVTQEMEFIDHENSVTLGLVRTPYMTHIEIGNDIFVPIGRRGGWALVIQNGTVVLLEETRFVPEAKRRGAYGTPLTTSSAYSITSLGPGSIIGIGGYANHAGVGGGANSSALLHLEQPVEYRIDREYWLMRDRNLYVATRRNFLRVYREVRPQLETFIEQNDIDFRNAQHLRGLTMFANSLLLAR